jgi:integrase
MSRCRFSSILSSVGCTPTRSSTASGFGSASTGPRGPTTRNGASTVSARSSSRHSDSSRKSTSPPHERRHESSPVASLRIEPGRRAAVRFKDALDEYLKHLEAKAANRGKPARWKHNVEQLAKTLLLPEWGKWPLADMSNSPEAVRDWHREISKSAGPVSANRAAAVMRACYRHASKLNRSLPPALPTSAVAFNQETPRETGLEFSDYPKWAAAWRKIENPVRRAFQLTSILTGGRPGELARLKWADVHPRTRSFVIRKSKSGIDIAIPMSTPIAKALRMARDAGREWNSEYVFPARDNGHIVKFDCDGLPAWGLRHSYRNVAADLEIDEPQTRLLRGHSLRGVSEKYISRLVLRSGGGLRAGQRRISQRIVELLKIELQQKGDWVAAIDDTPLTA